MTVTAAAFVAVVSAFAAFMAVVSAAAFVVSAFAAFVAVVIAGGIWIVFKSSFRKGLCCSIGSPLDSGIEPDPGICKGHLGAHAYASADHRVCL